MPGWTDRRYLADFGFLIALIALPAVPLLAWRGTTPSSLVPLVAVAGGWLVLLQAGSC